MQQLGLAEIGVLSILCLIIVLVIVILVLVMIKRAKAASPDNQPEQEGDSDTGQAWPYVTAPHFLTPAELSFYLVLNGVVKESLAICPKVNLGDVFHVESGSTNFTAWRNRINRRHVDFLLCEPRTMTPVLGIELDDDSHRKRQEEDRAKNRVFAAAGLPLLRVPCRHSYDTRKLRSDILSQFVQEDVEKTK